MQDDVVDCLLCFFAVVECQVYGANFQVHSRVAVVCLRPEGQVCSCLTGGLTESG